MSDAGVLAEHDPRETARVSTVELGEVTFDPVGVSDFRLSVEGTSNVGKSNTLAVILEDLAGITLPTLIIERLGALTSVRSEDESLIVVGAREEDGIDLGVALEELSRVGEWVLDHGQKILVDLSTYADYHDDGSRVHLAAATAIQSLNDRAHAKYRSGNRVKSLLVVDEAHFLAPKQGAPEPQPDEYVSRCRGQLIKASTEGGNKGISIITAYQRRAFLHNGVIQLCEDFVAHKPGAEDVDRTADALRCDAETLGSLGTGRIVARGATLTGDELVGPTTVRKRRSPDPREETFELPEISGQTEAFLELVADEVTAERDRREAHEDELERLRAENEQLQETVDRLERELEDSQRLAAAVETLQRQNGDPSAAVEKRVTELEARLDTVVDERDRALQRADALAADREEVIARHRHRERERAALEADRRELGHLVDVTAESMRQVAEALERGRGSADDREVESASNGGIDAFTRGSERHWRQLDIELATQLATYEELLGLDVVRDQVEAAKASAPTRYVTGVIAAVAAEGDWIPYDDIADRLGVATTTDVSKAATELERRQLVRKDRREDGVHVDLDIEGIQALRMAAADREDTERLMERL